jgi:hypothetical protein
MRDPLRGLAACASLPIEVAAAFALGGCTLPTTVLSNANPSRAPAAEWADYQTLPVDVHGTAPGYSKENLAALFPPYHPAQYAALGEIPAAATHRHMVLYVNPAYPPSQSQICDGAAHFPRGTQDGQSAYVAGALCDGARLITMASAKGLSGNN